MIPFSPPYIDQDAIDEVVEVLKSGWITSGPKTKLFEKMISEYVGSDTTLCLNSATAGLEMMLKWFGVKEGDEVIIPAYTYSATANVVIHCGATPVMVDSNKDDFNISVEEIRKNINERTKVIMPVDFAGFPVDYDEIMSLILEKKELFKASNDNQSKLGRILLLSDAAHSLGAIYKNKKTGVCADATCFSFHAVKNLTTAEGGAVCLNFPESIDHSEIYKELGIKSLHGQNKSALEKTKIGSWEYDIIEAGYKNNMPDILAALGISGLKKYETHVLPKRKEIFEQYSEVFGKYSWAQLPVYSNQEKTSSYHVYPLRIKNISLETRNMIMEEIFKQNVSVNVHFKPLPLMSFYKNLGYKMESYPIAFDNYSREISLPVYYTLSEENIHTVINTVIQAVSKYVVS